jgi:hypothetical protein
VEPTKSPDDQIAAFEKGDSSFCPYDFEPSESATLYVFKKAPDDAFLESLKAKREHGSDPVYMTVETSRKKKKAKLAHSPSESEKSDELISVCGSYSSEYYWRQQQ